MGLVANVLFKRDNQALKKGIAASDRNGWRLVRHSAVSIEQTTVGSPVIENHVME